jgi:DNA-binding CsgD family transcriptional regulator
MKRGTSPGGGESEHAAALLDHEQFRLLAESLLSVVFVVLDAGWTKVEYASPGIGSLLQRTAQREGQGRLGLLGAIHEADRERTRSEGEQCREGPREFDVRLHDAEGRLRWLRCRGFPIRDAAGVVRRLGFVLEDRTTQRQAYALLDDLQRHAAALARAAGDPFGVLRRALDVVPGDVEAATGGRRAPLASAPAQDGFAARSALLTRREREVMERLVGGKSAKAIAESLGLSRKTVESHRTQVMHKMGLGNVAELVRLALLARPRRGAAR